MNDQGAFEFPENRGRLRRRQPRRDLAFETLVRVTHTNVAVGRGKTNAALAAIREAWHNEGGLEEDLPQEIELRAKAYREMWPRVALSPNALANNWVRVMAQREQPMRESKRAIDELRKENRDA